MSNLSSWLGKILPSIGTVLGGPLGGLGIEAVCSALGLSEKTKESVEKILTSGNLTAEQMAALRKADQNLALKLKELGIEAEKLNASDRASARDLQKATGSKTPSTLAIVITVGYFAVLFGLLSGELKLWDNSGITMLIGALTAAWGSLVNFYYGSSFKLPDDKK